LYDFTDVKDFTDFTDFTDFKLCTRGLLKWSVL
jgi:hypothetical protein